MAQKMITNRLLEKSMKKNISTQTNENDPEFYINISKNKNIRLYYCKSHNDYVLSINFGNCKSFIITRSMWKIFRCYLTRIDKVLYNRE